MSTKPAAQLSLETILKQNADEAKRLKAAADEKLAENARIEAEMHRILSEPSSQQAPGSRIVEAYKNGAAMGLLELENRNTQQPSSAPSSVKMVAEKEVLYAALAIVRSWKRRRKKNWQTQEKELMNAVEKLTWDK
jgi:hypothetical protein